MHGTEELKLVYACVSYMHKDYYDYYAMIIDIIKNKMRTILAIAVITCFFAVPISSQFNLNCVNRLTDLGSCITRLGTATLDSTDFCNECGNSLVSYYRDCAGGVGVDSVQAGDL